MYQNKTNEDNSRPVEKLLFRLLIQLFFLTVSMYDYIH